MTSTTCMDPTTSVDAALIALRYPECLYPVASGAVDSERSSRSPSRRRRPSRAPRALLLGVDHFPSSAAVVRCCISAESGAAVHSNGGGAAVNVGELLEIATAYAESRRGVRAALVGLFEQHALRWGSITHPHPSSLPPLSDHDRRQFSVRCVDAVVQGISRLVAPPASPLSPPSSCCGSSCSTGVRAVSPSSSLAPSPVVAAAPMGCGRRRPSPLPSCRWAVPTGLTTLDSWLGHDSSLLSSSSATPEGSGAGRGGGGGGLRRGGVTEIVGPAGVGKSNVSFAMIVHVVATRMILERGECQPQPTPIVMTRPRHGDGHHLAPAAPHITPVGVLIVSEDVPIQRIHEMCRATWSRLLGDKIPPPSLQEQLRGAASLLERILIYKLVANTSDELLRALDQIVAQFRVHAVVSGNQPAGATSQPAESSSAAAGRIIDLVVIDSITAALADDDDDDEDRPEDGSGEREDAEGGAVDAMRSHHGVGPRLSDASSANPTNRVKSKTTLFQGKSRRRGPREPRAAVVARVGASLRRLSAACDCAVLVTNQVRAFLGPDEPTSSSSAPASSPYAPVCPRGFVPRRADHQHHLTVAGSSHGSAPSPTQCAALGMAWAHGVSTRLWLSRIVSDDDDNAGGSPLQSAPFNRCLRLVWSPCIPAGIDCDALEKGLRLRITCAGVEQMPLVDSE